MPDRILVVDDEPDLLELVRVTLAGAGHAVETAQRGREALTALRRHPPDLLVLDWMLPDLSGAEICRQIRSDPQLRELPIVFLTARGEEMDRVVGLELGADDYVTKPFSTRELMLRVNAVLRRSRSEPPPRAALEHAGIVLDRERHRCTAGGAAVELTAKEFELLAALLERPGRVMSRERLLEEVWGRDVVVTERTIDTHMKRLREKLGVAGERLETVRGVGYRLAE